MSIESWKQEFYPVPAEEAATGNVAALKHSIVKWHGLRPENLDKHNVTPVGTHYIGTTENDSEELAGSGSCALCVLVSDTCAVCVLTEVNSTCGESWHLWVYKRDPEPMIAQLEHALKIVDPANSTENSNAQQIAS